MNVLIRVGIAVTAVCLLATPGWSQMIVAHRGASYDAPENTLAAFKLAWEQNSDGIEGDFYLTADQQIVCIHDADTKRTAGTVLEVEQSTLSQLRELEYGNWKAAKWQGEPIPTLADVFQTVPEGKKFVIELKSKVAIVPFLAAELKRLDTGAIDVLIISFDQETIAACKQQIPKARTHWLTSFKDGQPTAPQVAEFVKETGADGVGMKADRSVIDREFIQQLQQGGCREFHLWTVDSVDDAKYFQALGAIGLTTNVPGVIGPAIRSKLDSDHAKN
jgi:glycerophosphoryl diester phosphodiesterase